MKKFILFALISLQLINVALSCSCIPTPGVLEEFKISKAVFVGKVMKIQTVGMEKIVLLRVLASWKGIFSKWVYVRTCENSACCGFNFELHKTYLIYAGTDQNNKIHVSLCSRTTEIINAAADIAILNNLTKNVIVQDNKGGIVDQK
jgi:hypothetical protein